MATATEPPSLPNRGRADRYSTRTQLLETVDFPGARRECRVALSTNVDCRFATQGG